ncbi:MAG: glutathione S-transferase family protein [Deltaproteobacteria bacterium]|nr:glutathione S-transferase family protein [Deltaproteobacteria bacterium]
MKLYSNPFSPNCRKVHALIKHLGLNVENETVDLMKGAQNEPAYMAINPNAKVPALVDGQTKIWESNAILAYLASKQDTKLWPKNSDRYQILQWMNWEACHFAPAVSKLIGQYIFAPLRGNQPDQAIIDQGLADFRKYAAVANGQLESTQFLAGDQLTIADLSVGVWLSYAEVCKLPLNEFTHLKRWWHDLQAVKGGTELAAPKM